MKIVILDGYTVNPGDLNWGRIAKHGELKVFDHLIPSQVGIRNRIGSAEAILTNKTVISKEIIEDCPKLHYIGVLATGYNNIDIAAAKEHGVTVTNIPNYSTASVAQHTFALLLEICSHVGAHNSFVHDGGWSSCPDPSHAVSTIIELEGKTIGVIGFGQIGRTVGRIARGFGMRVLAAGSHETPKGREIGEYVSLEKLLSLSDVISMNCLLNESTKGLINSKTISQMKDGAILINTSRGGVIVEQDLAEALNNGKLSAAGLDVVSVEPIQRTNPLLTAKNCVITSHCAWMPKEARERLMKIASDNLEQYLKGTPINVVG